MGVAKFSVIDADLATRECSQFGQMYADFREHCMNSIFIIFKYMCGYSPLTDARYIDG